MEENVNDDLRGIAVDATPGGGSRKVKTRTLNTAGCGTRREEENGFKNKRSKSLVALAVTRCAPGGEATRKIGSPEQAPAGESGSPSCLRINKLPHSKKGGRFRNEASQHF